ncbi:MAG TPA: putative cytokinetic ring protein SteA [Candidatus Limnocylindria bacterium]|nr:putative cytokinetic ring protein SteA [Candidatus Limnocylindria bacterium]
MRLPSRRREPEPAPMGVTGQVRLDPSTRALLRRVKPGDIALVDEVDLDQVTAESLARSGVGGVVNIAPSISGRYPALGAAVLVEAGIPLVDDVGHDVVGRVTDGDVVRLHGRELLVGQRVVAEGVVQSAELVGAASALARSGLQGQLEAFAGSAPSVLDAEQDLVLDGAGMPEIATPLEGRPVLVVSRGPRDTSDLADLTLWMREQRPVLVGVGAGADVLLAAGHTPDLVLGDVDDVSDEALATDAEVVVHGFRDGRTPGLERARLHRSAPVVFTSNATSEDLAVLMALHGGASLIVTAGAADDLVELLDRDRAGMTSTVLTRLRAGGRLVDSQGVAQLYRSGVPGWQLLVLLLAGLAAVLVAILLTPAGQSAWDRLGGS